MKMVIANGRVIDPESGFDGLADLMTEDGKITGIWRRDSQDRRDTDGGAGWHPADGTDPGVCGGEPARVIDAAGLIVAPGPVDVHVHFRDPGLTWKEDILTGAAAAKAGGYTTVVCMANTKPAADTPEVIRYITEKGRETGLHVLAAAAVTKGLKGREITDMQALDESGAA